VAELQLITDALFERIAQLAAASPRRRMNHNFHATALDNPHRFLNILLKDTYVRPHRHSDPPKSESFLVLEGAARLIVFDDAGSVQSRFNLGCESPEGKVWGVDLPPGVWHTIVALTDRAVCFEVKPGPWEPASDKEFASWAPAENDPAVEAYRNTLLHQ
jgi:cupin fold WbuC family metalloprotein